MTRDPVIIVGLAFIALMLCVVIPAGARALFALDEYYELEIPTAPVRDPIFGPKEFPPLPRSEP